MRPSCSVTWRGLGYQKMRTQEPNGDERYGRTALIGHTGFVGSTLARQGVFDDYFNSKSIHEIGARRFDVVVCAAAPGSMFEANKFPERDRVRVDALIDQLSRVRAERFILISSIAVLADFANGGDERTATFQMEMAYGRHRRALETFAEEHFQSSLVVRLPALFGRGLRKNLIFDLLNPVPSMLTRSRLDALAAALDADLKNWLRDLYSYDAATEMLKLDRKTLNADPRRDVLNEAVRELGFSATQFHNSQSTYQFYDMSCLWPDICTALGGGLSCIHLVAEPLKVEHIYSRLIGCKMPDTGADLHHEDMRTRHASLWGVAGPYLVDNETTLDRLAAFFSLGGQTE